MDSRFCCNICFDPVEEPVVTQCGHLYCWPCLFRWLEPGMTLLERQSLQLGPLHTLEPDTSRRLCPVCKRSCFVSNLIPLYVRSHSVPDGSTSQTSIIASATAVDSQVDNESLAVNSNREAAVAAADPVESSNNLSDINVKRSSSSTIATEQEDDEDAVREHNEGPLLVGRARLTENQQSAVRRHSQTQQTEPSLSVDGRHSWTAPPATALNGLQRLRSDSTTPQVPISENLLVSNTINSRFDALDRRPRSFSENAVGIIQQQQEHTTASRALALSQGLALTLQRALQPTVSTNSTAQSAAQDAASIVVPSLHRAEGFGNAAAMNSSNLQHEATDPDATEFLSRILLMLASFVILCLLLF